MKTDRRCSLHRSDRRVIVSKVPMMSKEMTDLLFSILGPLKKRRHPPLFKASCWNHDGSFCVERLTRRRQWQGKKKLEVKLRLSLPVGDAEMLVIECESGNSDDEAWKLLAKRLIHATSALIEERLKRGAAT